MPELLRSEERLTPDLMMVISEHLGGAGWDTVLAQLPDISYAKIEQKMEERRNVISQVIYDILRDWKEDKDEKATIGIITNLLWRNHWDVVYIMKEVYKMNHVDN